jgi:hypothetical protein
MPASRIMITEETTVRSMVPMVTGSLNTRTLNQLKQAAAVMMVLVSASVVIPVPSLRDCV